MYYLLTQQDAIALKTALSFFKDIIAIIAPVIAGYLGIKFGIKQFREQKKINLIEEQLNKFYSPMLGIREEIRGISELRAEIQNISGQVWKEKTDAERMRDHEYINKEINYDNNKWREELFPLYKRMLDIFRENYWLAEQETQEHYKLFLKFVELHNRWLKDGIDPGAVKKLDYSESKLDFFYKELENRTDILKKKLLD